jgi:magnesium chelatase family protein
MGRVSGPLLDRIDLHVEVPAVPFQELSAPADGTSSAQMRQQVDAARAVQRARFGGGGQRLNGQMTGRQLRKHCALDEAGRGLLKQAILDSGSVTTWKCAPTSTSWPPRGPSRPLRWERPGGQAKPEA